MRNAITVAEGILACADSQQRYVSAMLREIL
jgi:hypothetical protein